jgi:hypothetical protein
VGIPPANTIQQNRVYELQRFTRLQDEATVVALTGNALGFFHNYTLLDNVRARYLRDERGGFFARQGKAMQIPFMAEDDEEMFAAAIFFNFSPKGVQLMDFHPEGRGHVRRLHDVEVCVKHLQAFWDMAYVTSDQDGPIPITAVWEPFLRQLDTSTLLLLLSPDYIVAVVDMVLRALAAQLDSVSPGGVRIPPRGWWEIIGSKLGSMSFTKDNQEYFELVHGKRGQHGFHARGAAALPADGLGGGRLGLPPAVVSPAPKGAAPKEGPQVCFTELRHHYKVPGGAPACAHGKDCTRLHPGKFKTLSLDKVVQQLVGAKGDYKDVLPAVLADAASFSA